MRQMERVGGNLDTSVCRQRANGTLLCDSGAQTGLPSNLWREVGGRFKREK